MTITYTYQDEDQKYAESIQNFQKYLDRFDSYADAIISIVEFNNFQNTSDVEDFVWQQDILSTEFGHNVLIDLTIEFEKELV